MQIVLHPRVRSDIFAVMEYYERVATPELADDFYRELRQFMQDAAENPKPTPSAPATFAG
jgi:plasmid stabilization system protein ParE